MASKVVTFALFCVVAVCLLTAAIGYGDRLQSGGPHETDPPVSATCASVQLPAVYPLVNILLPLLNNVYNLLLSLLSIFDTLPSSISCLIPVDLGALETSLLKLYSQALAIVNFLRSLPEYAAGANPSTPPANIKNLQGLLTSLVTAITDLAEDLLLPIGGGLLPGLLQLVVCLVETLLKLLL